MLSDSPATPGGTKLVKESEIIKAFQTINEDLTNKPDLVDKCRWHQLHTCCTFLRGISPGLL